MNEKAAKLARVINRAAGTLVKRSYEDVQMPALTGDVAADVAAQAGATTKRPHKLTRKVKRWWNSLSHKERGFASHYWKQVADHSREARALAIETPTGTPVVVEVPA